MNVVALQVFVSLALVAGSIVLFVFSVRQRDFEHADRLALAPLEDDAYPAADPADGESNRVDGARLCRAESFAGGRGNPPRVPTDKERDHAHRTD